MSTEDECMVKEALVTFFLLGGISHFFLVWFEKIKRYKWRGCRGCHLSRFLIAGDGRTTIMMLCAVVVIISLLNWMRWDARQATAEKKNYSAKWGDITSSCVGIFTGTMETTRHDIWVGWLKSRPGALEEQSTT